MTEIGKQGLYTPDDMLWKLNREWLMVLAGARAVLLEIAHPLVAAGVAYHSDFERRPFKRLIRTVDASRHLSFGGGEAARRAARGINRAHQAVRGELQEETGPHQAGTRYSALDPELGLWVFATVVDSILVTYSRFVRPLTEREQATYYQDSKRMAHLLGVPPASMPDSFADFQAYMDRMLYGDTLVVGETGRAIVKALYGHPLFGPFAYVGSWPGIDMLPAPLREGFGFEWGEKQARWVERLARVTRWLRPKLPDVLSVHPEAWIRERLYRRSQNQQASGTI